MPDNLNGMEFLGALGEASVMLHEMFTDLMTAGFTEDQALRLVAYMTMANRAEPDDNG